MPRYTDQSKEKVRDAVDFADLVGRYTELRRSGPDAMKGLCPFHEERSPSFNVHVSDKWFKCFGCQAGGDLFTFIQLKEGLDFPAALEWLADRYGVELEVADEAPEQVARREARTRLLGLLERTATFYARLLWESGEAAGAREYLASRGLEEPLLREFRVGFSPSAWDKVLLASRRAGFSEQELYDAGLVQRNAKTGRVYDRFRGRVMFPLCDRRGKVLGFGARRLGEGDSPKYLNSDTNLVFQKGQHVYAADIARGHAARVQQVILCEGYTDVIALHQAGIRHTVGLMGTALTAEQVLELQRLAPVVLLALDADSAGQEAMLKAATIAAGRGVELRVIPLPAGKDPADVVQEHGAAAMRDLVERSVPFVRFRVDTVLARAHTERAEDKDRAIAELAPIIAEVPPSVLRQEILRDTANRLDVEPGLLEQMLGAPRRDPIGGRDEPQFAASAAPAPPPPTVVSDPLVQGERKLLAACLAAGPIGGELLAALDLDDELSVALHRRAAAHLRAHAAAIGTGLERGDELEPLIAELKIRAADMRPPTRATLEAQLAELRLARLDRRIQQATAAGESVAELAAQRTALKRAVDDAIGRTLDE